MSTIDLGTLSVSELNHLKGNIDNAIDQRRQSELMDLNNQIHALVDASPFTLEEILNARKVRKPVAPKYQNPDDSTLTWTGRGRRPLWVEEQLNNGKTLEDLAI